MLHCLNQAITHIGVCHRLWRWRSSRSWRDRLCGHAHFTGVCAACVYQEGGGELRRKALPGAECRGRGVLVGWRRGWETRTRQQDVSGGFVIYNDPASIATLAQRRHWSASSRSAADVAPTSVFRRLRCYGLLAFCRSATVGVS